MHGLRSRSFWFRLDGFRELLPNRSIQDDDWSPTRAAFGYGRRLNDPTVTQVFLSQEDFSPNGVCLMAFRLAGISGDLKLFQHR